MGSKRSDAAKRAWKKRKAEAKRRSSAAKKGWVTRKQNANIRHASNLDKLQSNLKRDVGATDSETVRALRAELAATKRALESHKADRAEADKAATNLIAELAHERRVLERIVAYQEHRQSREKYLRPDGKLALTPSRLRHEDDARAIHDALSALAKKARASKNWQEFYDYSYEIGEQYEVDISEVYNFYFSE